MVGAAIVLAGCGTTSTAEETAPASTAEPEDTASSSSSTAEPERTTSSSSTETAAPADDGEAFFPDVIAAEATPDGPDSWRFSVTISSPYDTPEQYADAWRVLGPDGAEYGIRVLTHDHASEQPFTRSQGGIVIPPDVQRVIIEGRDLRNGWGGTTLEIELPTRS